VKINARVTKVSHHEGGGVLVELFAYNFDTRPEALRVWWKEPDPVPAPGDFVALHIAPNPEP
jgi:hypothetical protein